jgi:S-adenosylmethionine/arginine decarboxylase-like enzyme
MFVPNHLHLIVRALVKSPPRSVKATNDWLIKLVDLVDMQVVAGPTSVYVDEPGNEGVTGTITLATSHAAIHVWDHVKPALVQFDIYSCKEYSIDTVLNHMNRFGLIEVDYLFLDRNDGIKIIAEDHLLGKNS